MLNAFAPIVFSRIPVIADTVYRKLFSFDITKQYFLIHHEGFEGFVPTIHGNVTLESAEIVFRKDMLSRYLKRVLTQSDWNDTFLQYLTRVGRMHTTKGGSSSIHVDYIHINALFGYLQHLLLDVLLNAENLDDKIRHAMIIAVNKFFCIQNDFFTMHFITTSKENSTLDETSKEKINYCCT
jgi:hypothetical protein